MPNLLTRRFGRTELPIPVLSLGGMRFQQSWSDLPADEITSDSQSNLQATLQRATDLGFHHVETARHYGSSERQLGWAITTTPDPTRILQSKVPPREDPDAFEDELALSFERLGCQRLDLLAIHGINLPEHLEQTLRPGGCMDVVRRWQVDGRIGHVGFSTHGPTDVIVASCDSGAFDYMNVHWYYIRQDNTRALDAAQRRTWGCSSSVPPTRAAISTHPLSVCWSCVIRCIPSSSTISSVCVTPGCTPSASGRLDRRIWICTSRPLLGWWMPMR